ncbi:MAG TPA: hypothetical protein VKZ53_22240 [Candidatus Angelobacter sp.]|nr:hypothetical protein [Candidatus Angelobacter sp.]
MIKHKVPDAMQSVLDRTELDLLCALLVAYRGVSLYGGEWHGKVKDTLAALRQHLGQDQYGRFQFDLVRKMNFVPAWCAVVEIIGAAVKRRKAARTTESMKAVAV